MFRCFHKVAIFFLLNDFDYFNELLIRHLLDADVLPFTKCNGLTAGARSFFSLCKQ